MENIFLFSGNNRFSIDQHIKKIICELDRPAIVKYDNKNFCFEKILSEITFVDLFNPTKVIIVELDIFHLKKEDQDFFASILKDVPIKNLIIIICPKTLKSAPIYKKIFSKNKNIFNYTQPDESSKKDVVSHISKTLKENSIDVEDSIIRLMTDLMGYDSNIVLIEAKRLYEKYKRINEKIVKEHIPKTYFNIFDIGEIFAKREINRTLTMYDAMIDSGFNFHEIFMTIYRQIRILFLVSTVTNQYGVRDYNQIAGILKMHPYIVKKNLEYVKNYKYEELQVAFKKLIEYQRKMYNNGSNSEIILKVMLTDIMAG